MLIKEACRLCGLTKKAIQYYEDHGLISPELLANGYRNYSEQDIHDLKEIAVLRSCGIAVQHIREIMRSPDKSATLMKFKHLHQLKWLQLEQVQANLEQLIQNYNIEDSFQYLQHQDQAGLTIREKLVNSFPGSFGVYLSVHFGRFLNHPIETKQQRIAYEQILSYLDDVPMKISEELSAHLDKVTLFTDSNQIEQIVQDISDTLEPALAHPEQYLDSPKFSTYIAYRSSDEYKQSSEGKMLELLTEFQKYSGYKEVFISNLKILSPSYASYNAKLEALNTQFLAKHPEASKWYE